MQSKMQSSLNLVINWHVKDLSSFFYLMQIIMQFQYCHINYNKNVIQKC